VLVRRLDAEPDARRRIGENGDGDEGEEEDGGAQAHLRRLAHLSYGVDLPLDVGRLRAARAGGPAGPRGAAGRLDPERHRDLIALVQALERSLREVEIELLALRVDLHPSRVPVEVGDAAGHRVLA